MENEEFIFHMTKHAFVSSFRRRQMHVVSAFFIYPLGK